MQWPEGLQAGLCAFVVIGLSAWGEEYFPVIEDGIRESIQSWREVLLKLKSRGMNVPELAVGDGAMGFSLHGTAFNRRLLTAFATRWLGDGSGSSWCLRACIGPPPHPPPPTEGARD